MASISGRTLFFVTSPRSPMKMVPEIKLLAEHFSGKAWNVPLQAKFMEVLLQDENFLNVAKPKDPAFSARDRITRGPKSLGFVDLKPTIQLTEAGKLFIDENTSQEALLRQLLKFQIPSPFHTESSSISGTFFVKPYLEIFRLIYTMERITFDELMLFGMQLTSYMKFDSVVSKIMAFRENKKKYSGSYRNYLGACIENEIYEIFSEEIGEGNVKTRESKDKSINKFINTKKSNLHDYADACFRYLRATGMVAISQKGHSLSILEEKKEEVKFFLDTIDRTPVYIDQEAKYKEYLFDVTKPALFTDNKDKLVEKVVANDILNIEAASNADVNVLKKLLHAYMETQKQARIESQVQDLKAYQNYADILSVFSDISEKKFYDMPLMLEWNTWRAMTMLDGGNIKANLRFDDDGQPLSTAPGNQADIICDYGDFSLAVEVTMSSGQKQYEMEGEPVSRHLAKLKKEVGKAYCFFIAPTINEACIAHFFMLHKTNISYYGGKSVVIPLELSTFEKMVKASGQASYTPNPKMIEKLCDYSMKLAQIASDEQEWFAGIQQKAADWLSAA